MKKGALSGALASLPAVCRRRQPAVRACEPQVLGIVLALENDAEADMYRPRFGGVVRGSAVWDDVPVRRYAGNGQDFRSSRLDMEQPVPVDPGIGRPVIVLAGMCLRRDCRRAADVGEAVLGVVHAVE